MESCKNEGVGFEDSGPTIQFIKRIDEVAEAMNSQIPEEGLRVDPRSQHKVIILLNCKRC